MLFKKLCCCISNGIQSSDIFLPDKEGIPLSAIEIVEIIKKNLKMDYSNIHLLDEKYFAIPLKSLQKFMKYDFTNFSQYKKEIFDCDDFSLVFAGAQHHWFSRLNINRASTVGIVIGDIRTSELSTKERFHAANFFITNTKELLIVEPMNDKVYKPTSNSTFAFVLL